MNNMLGECDYRTPCKWCSKWDKPCDKSQGAKAQVIGQTLHDVFPTIAAAEKALKEGLHD